MRLTTTAPYDGRGLLAFLAARAIPGVEVVEGDTYRRTLALPGGPAAIAVTVRDGDDGVTLATTGVAAGDQPKVIASVRSLFGLDQDPAAVLAALGDDPALGPLVHARPGLRVPGAVDGFEIALRAVLGQQITVAAARTLAGRITAQLGERVTVEDPAPGTATAARAAALPAPGAAASPAPATAALTHLLPTPAALAAAPAEIFPMPRSRIRTLQGLGAAAPRLDGPDDAPALTALHGIGPWTASYVALRLGDPDVFLPTDVAIRKALQLLEQTTADAPRWAPLRSFATVHLWASLAKPPR